MATRPRAAKATALLGGPLRGRRVRTLAWRAGSQPSAVEWLLWPGPDLNSVTPAPFDHAQTGIVLAGAQFEAAQGAGAVELGNSADYATASKQAQTVTAWSSTSITITANLGSLGPGIRWLFVTTNGALTSEGRPVLVRRAAAFTDSLSANITAGGADATTARLTAPAGKSTGDFDAGRRVDDSATTPAATTTASDYTEHEWALEATAAAVTSSTYQFRVVRSTGEVPGALPVTPEWTISAGGGPVAGSTTAGLTVAARVTGAKVAASSTRATTGVTARATAAKIATGSTRATAGISARVTGAKIAIATSRAVAGLVARIVGAPFNNTAAGSALAALAVVARATGAKIATGSATAATPVTARPAGAKVAAGQVRALAGAVARVTPAKVAGGAVRALAIGSARATGTKTATAGGARATLTGTVSATAAKLATAGAARTVGAVVARVSSTPPGVVAGSARAVVAVVARVTGAKVAGGSGRAGAAVAARPAGSKVAAGAAQVLAGVTGRAATLKRAGGAVVAAGGITARAPGAKVGRASVRAAVAVIVRTPSRAPVEAWSWYLRRAGAWLPASPKVDGVHPTTTDVT